jgi:hypothetical protein
VEARDEVGVLFLFNDLLELKRKPVPCTLVGRPHVDAWSLLLAGDFNFVWLYNVLEDGPVTWTQYTSSLITYLDDDYKRRLKERRICCWVEDRCAGLEGLEEPANISAERKIVAEKNLLDLRDELLLGYRHIADERDWISLCWIIREEYLLEGTFPRSPRLGFVDQSVKGRLQEIDQTFKVECYD